jgi:hypothetical protein
VQREWHTRTRTSHQYRQDFFGAIYFPVRAYGARGKRLSIGVTHCEPNGSLRLRIDDV